VPTPPTMLSAHRRPAASVHAARENGESLSIPMLIIILTKYILTSSILWRLSMTFCLENGDGRVI
jgi:hypothetical protein